MKTKKCSSVVVYYINHNDKVMREVIELEKEDCLSCGSLKDDAEEIIFNMFEDNGLWVCKNIFIPFHRVLSIEITDVDINSEKQKEKNIANSNLNKQNPVVKKNKRIRHKKSNSNSNKTDTVKKNL